MIYLPNYYSWNQFGYIYIYIYFLITTFPTYLSATKPIIFLINSKTHYSYTAFNFNLCLYIYHFVHKWIFSWTSHPRKWLVNSGKIKFTLFIFIMKKWSNQHYSFLDKPHIYTHTHTHPWVDDMETLCVSIYSINFVF